jgi:hypothetical protein
LKGQKQKSLEPYYRKLTSYNNELNNPQQLKKIKKGQRQAQKKNKHGSSNSKVRKPNYNEAKKFGPIENGGPLFNKVGIEHQPPSTQIGSKHMPSREKKKEERERERERETEREEPKKNKRRIKKELQRELSVAQPTNRACSQTKNHSQNPVWLPFHDVP